MRHGVGERMDFLKKSTTIMGVLNVTPDSFSDGGKFIDIDHAVAHARQMEDEGADIIDVGGESTRPGSDPVREEEELRRVIPVIERLAHEVTVPISIDTYKPRVAEAALIAGARMVNDVSGLRNEEMIAVVARAHVPVVIMHMLGEPKSMQENPEYRDVVDDIKHFFEDRIRIAQVAGITDVILDPGIGFGKKLEHNLEILRRLREFETLGLPILVGVSRKSFIGALSGAPVEERLPGSIAAAVIAVGNGASIVRVHDVKATRQALAIVNAVYGR